MQTQIALRKIRPATANLFCLRYAAGDYLDASPEGEPIAFGPCELKTNPVTALDSWIA